MKLKLADFIATVFKIGTLPIAPGTFGSLAALGVWFWIYPYFTLPIFIILTIIILAVGVYTSTIIERKTKEVDPSRIVIDEWVGQWIALWFVPQTLAFGFAAFILFRVFDIWKPGPIRKLDKLQNGWGVMLDDVAAGLLAGLILFGYKMYA